MKNLFWFLSCCFLLKATHGVTEEEVDSLTEYIQNEQKKTENAELPVDSSSYKPTVSGPPENYGEYDFIIVGAGATGSILANRMSEEKQFKILLIEAGDFPNNFTYMPAMIDASRFTKYNWGYKSTPQKYSCLGMENRQCIIPRGRGVGGTTLINGLLYIRGHPLDFDKWEALGNPGWAYKDVLPLFKKTEGIVRNNPEAVVDWNYHNTKGPLHVEYYPSTDVQLDAFYKAHEALGYKFTDPNSPRQIGFTPKVVDIKNGKRFDDGTAFILPILNRDNLKVLTNSLVTKINFKNTIATGVTFSHSGKTYFATAKKELIISGGSINTPQLLMLSGVGPKKHLTEKGIRVVKDLSVGEKLYEHPAFYGLMFSSNYTEPIKPFKEYVREYLNGIGPLTLPGAMRGMAFYKSHLESQPTNPDMEILYGAGNCTAPAVQKAFAWNNDTWNATFATVNPAMCFQLIPIILHTKSIGYVKLKTNSPYDFPLINLNHLSDPRNLDIDRLYEAVQLSLKLAETEAFKKVNAKLSVKPLPACSEYSFKSKKYWYCAIRQMTYNMYHPVGTCPMGPDPGKGAVVNHELKVHGIDRLRVADASVFPFALSGHPNAPCVMIGEKLAMLLKKKYL